MTKTNPHTDEPVIALSEEVSKAVLLWARDQGDIASARVITGAAFYFIGFIVACTMDVTIYDDSYAFWLLAPLTLLTLGFWWNFIARFSLMVGLVGVIEGLIPALQIGIELDSPVTNDGRIAAANTFNVLSSIATGLVLTLAMAMVLPIPACTKPSVYVLACIGILIATLTPNFSTDRKKSTRDKPSPEKKDKK